MKRGTGVEAVSVSRFNVSTCNGVVAEAGCQKALEKPMADLEAEDGRASFFGLEKAFRCFSIFYSSWSGNDFHVDFEAAFQFD